MTVSHILGYPRIGARRELKKATEAYWQGECSREALETDWPRLAFCVIGKPSRRRDSIWSAWVTSRFTIRY